MWIKASTLIPQLHSRTCTIDGHTNKKTMKTFIAIALFVGLVAAYTTKYDNVDLDEILGNQRLYKKYFDCLVNKGKCTPDGKELKDAIPDALATACSKCNEKQKAGSEKVIRHMMKNHPADYDALEKLYDPSGTYRKKYQAEAKKLGLH
ncbi:ejaculatory bulb-specific protein 3-like [Cimex lectularius]|uniref:Chemosensory protein n=1 Tax=Cimex lectularius TaxID=79782 RepID=A0A8I6S414_CIMLE|nr:ejaculatory bulb-specific protein 3-like [Cimex lectularius]